MFVGRPGSQFNCPQFLIADGHPSTGINRICIANAPKHQAKPVTTRPKTCRYGGPGASLGVVDAIPSETEIRLEEFGRAKPFIFIFCVRHGLQRTKNGINL